ncbi:Valine--tRNA ligase [Trichinella spiralis]|uniref:Valine--tRNA ligase n=1 Tax=Trichinella spiralis TaxID=6334 RepID=A0ABR3KFA3_TRISP
MIATEEMYRRVDLLQEEYEAGLDKEVKTAMAERAEYRKGFRGITVHARTLSVGKVEAAGSQNTKANEATTSGWMMKKISDHIDRNVDALTAKGKEPHRTEISAAELLIIVFRERITVASRIEWDKLVKAEKLRTDLTASQRFIRLQAEAMAKSHSAGRNWNPESSSKSNLINADSERQSACQKQANGHIPSPFGCGQLPHLQELTQTPDCPEVLKADNSQRKTLAKKAGLYFSCFEPGHHAKRCGQRGRTAGG